MARYLVEAHVLEGRSVSELAAAHGVHRSWIYKLLARYREGGIEALQPRSRRPRSCKHETPEVLVQAIVALRNELVESGGLRWPRCGGLKWLHFASVGGWGCFFFFGWWGGVSGGGGGA